MHGKRRQIIISILGTFSAIFITLGITYSLFTYTKLGTTENTVTAGTLKLLYTENTGVGAGIALTDALPVADAVGKSYSTEGKVFDFSIEGTNTGTQIIPYEITLRKKNTSTLAENAVRIYLTEMTEESDTELLSPILYSDLVQTEIEVGDEIEKVIYTDVVPGGEEEYRKNFRLRMWVAEETDFSTGDYNGKTFTATVNVYSNVPLISAEEQNLRNNAEILSAKMDDTLLTKVSGKDYQYESSVPEGTTETTINIETKNPNSTVTIEKIDSLAYSSNSIKRMAVSKKVSLTDGDNYFKVTVLSENKKVEKQYGIKISTIETVLIFGKQFPVIKSNPTLTTSSNNTSDASGLYKSTATNDEKPTYYFRGNIKNNYVHFAGFTWRIVRINEDGTIRIVMQDGINKNTKYQFNPTMNNYTYMYYSNSNLENGAKYTLDNWYQTNIVSKGYDKYVVSGYYYCEQAKVKYSNSYTSENAMMEEYSSYKPNFKCEVDGNGMGLVNSNIGLLTSDEVVHAGGYFAQSNSNYYLNNNQTHWWTMSPSGFYTSSYDSGPSAWSVFSSGSLISDSVDSTLSALRPVLILKHDVTVTGSGTSGDMWKVVS